VGLNKDLKKYRWIMVVMVLFGAIQLMFWWSPGKILTNGIENWLNRKSDGVFRVEIDKVKIGVFTRNVHINGLKIMWSEEGLSKEDWDISQIRIQKLGYWNLIRHSIFDASEILIANPRIGIDKLPKWEASNTDALEKQSYIILAKVFNRVSIKTLLIEGGKLSLDNLIENGSVRHEALVNLEFTSIATTADSTLEFSDLIIHLNDYTLHLPDDIHVIFCNSIRFSTLENKIFAQKLSLKPKNLVPPGSAWRYDFEIDAISISTPDFLSDLQSGNINWPSLEITQPRLSFISDLDFSKPSTQNAELNPFSLIDGLVNYVAIQQLSIRKASVTFKTEVESTEVPIAAYDVNIILENFYFDSASYFSPNRILFSSNGSLSLGELQIELADSVHILSASNFFFSTYTQEFRASNLEISPLKSSETKLQADRKPYFRIYLPGIDLSGIDVKKIYHSRDFIVENLNLAEPRIHLFFFEEQDQSTQDLDLYRLTSKYFKSIQADTLAIINSRLTVSNVKNRGRDTLSLGNMEIRLFGLEIDSATHQKTGENLFYARNLDMKLSNYILRLADGVHGLNAELLELNTFDSTIRLQNVELKPILGNDLDRYPGKESLIYLKVPELSMTGATIKDGFFKRELAVRYLGAENPVMNLITVVRKPASGIKDAEVMGIQDFEELLSQYVGFLQIDSLAINNGKWSSSLTNRNGKSWIADTEITASVLGMGFDGQTLLDKHFSAINSSFSLRNLELSLPDGRHQISALWQVSIGFKGNYIFRIFELFPSI
jgi:hypothetical protein